MMQQDQSCPSDSTSLGTSSKGRCSTAAGERQTRGERERERNQDLQYLHSPENTLLPAPTPLIMPGSLLPTVPSIPSTNTLLRLAEIATKCTCQSVIHMFLSLRAYVDNWQLVSPIHHFSSLLWRLFSYTVITPSVNSYKHKPPPVPVTDSSATLKQHGSKHRADKASGGTGETSSGVAGM